MLRHLATHKYYMRVCVCVCIYIYIYVYIYIIYIYTHISGMIWKFPKMVVH